MATSANIKLSIINSMLRTIGTAPLAGEDTRHPDYINAEAVLNEVLEEFSSKALWFNTAIRTLTQDVNGRIAIPNNTIVIDPIDGQINLSARDRYLWNNDDNTDVIGLDIECLMTFEVEYQNMPIEAIKFLRAEARRRFYLDEDGGGLKLQVYQADADKAKMKLDAVNIARQDLNFYNSRSGRAFYIPRPSSYQHIGSQGGTFRTENYKAGNFR